MGNATLIAHAGGRMKTREELGGLHTPEPTKSWKPVSHRDLVQELITGLSAKSISVTREQYATLGKEDARLFGALDLIVPTMDNPDFTLALGLRASNDQSLAIEFIAAARVFVCDNMCFSGSGGAVCLKRKHTSGLDLSREIPAALDQFLEKAGHYQLDLGRMREVTISDGRAKEMIVDAFRGKAPILPVRLFPDVVNLYFDDEEQKAKFPDRSLWSLNQAYTQAVKALNPGPQHQCGRKIGRYFGDALRKIFPSERN